MTALTYADRIRVRDERNQLAIDTLLDDEWTPTIALAAHFDGHAAWHPVRRRRVIQLRDVLTRLYLAGQVERQPWAWGQGYEWRRRTR